MEEKIRELIENYQDNIDKLHRLQIKLVKLLDYNTKITAAYGHNAGGGKGSVSSKVERHALKIYETQQQLFEVSNKITMVDNAQRVLNNKENKVMDLIKIHRNKLTKIAKAIGKDKNYVFTTRNRAIKKMCDYIRSNNV